VAQVSLGAYRSEKGSLAMKEVAVESFLRQPPFFTASFRDVREVPKLPPRRTFWSRFL
jgi:hypothetical protein